MEFSVSREIAGDPEFCALADELELSPVRSDSDAALHRLLREVPRLIGFALKHCFCEGKPTAEEQRAQQIAQALHLNLECCDMGPDGIDREVISLIEDPQTNTLLRELAAIAQRKRVAKSAGKRTIGPSPILSHLDDYAGLITYSDEAP